jgi:outer membrane protein TolC
MKIRLVILLCFFALSVQAQSSYTVEECINYALKNQGSIAKQRLEEDIQKEVNKEVLALTRPQVTAAGSFQYLFIVPKQRGDANAFNFGDAFGLFVIDSAKLAANPPEPLTEYEQEYSEFQFGLPLSASLNVQVQQIFFDPSVIIGLEARESLNQLAKLNTKRSEEELKINISKAYYNAVIAQTRSDLLDENISLITKMEDMTQKLYNEGFAEKIDVLRLTVQKNNLLTEKTKINNLIEVSYYLLKFQMGMPLTEGISLKNKLTDEAIKEDLFLSNAVDYEQRTEMKLLNLGVELNKLDYKRYEKSWLPTVAGVAQLGYATQTKRFTELFTLPYFPTGAIGLSVNMPIYGGGQRKAKMKQAELKIKQNEFDIKNFRQAMDFEVSNARTALRNSILSLDNQKANIALAEKVYTIARAKYKEGLGSNIEIIQAQTSLKEAQTNYFNSLYDAMIAKIDLRKALGIYK